ncbi:hypothetical protein CDL12_26729 [Handroanthus impetiginosus]|uniref:Uncharacterized protein n=1 Tax=Handroanthus impetiginosus TaxID=429701 RepID=A0A2G9G636_9LAMI|nr:hypothetical protein CDL12_26729 [Handroanthus impetiginosus]
MGCLHLPTMAKAVFDILLGAMQFSTKFLSRRKEISCFDVLISASRHICCCGLICACDATFISIFTELYPNSSILLLIPVSRHCFFQIANMKDCWLPGLKPRG